MIKLTRTLFFLLSCLLINATCFADGGGPLLLLINVYVFAVGQVWILVSEFIYLFIWLKPAALTKAKLLKISFVMNILSTAVGAVLFPLLLALLTLPGVFYMKTKWGGLLMALGTWVAGDNSPYPKVAMGAAIAGFAVTFILTVWIEYKYLRRVSQKQQIGFGDNLLRHCIYFNLISYAGLIALFFSLGFA